MAKPTSEELRKQVWDALFKFKGDRIAAAESLGKSPRTLNRYISELDLYEDMDKAGLMKNHGPPRGHAPGVSLRARAVVDHIQQNKGEMDYAELAQYMYGRSDEVTRQRVYQTITELKSKGVIATDGYRWFVL